MFLEEKINLGRFSFEVDHGAAEKNLTLRPGHRTSEFFPAVAYFLPDPKREVDNFYWAGRINVDFEIIRDLRSAHSVYDQEPINQDVFYATGNSKIDVCQKLNFARRIFGDISQLSLKMSKKMNETIDVSSIMEDALYNGPEFIRAMYQTSKLFEVYPNLSCRVCTGSMNPIFDEVFPSSATFYDEFFCENCWYQINEEFVRQKKIENAPIHCKSRARRSLAVANGDKGIHWSTVGIRDEWVCHICQEIVQEIAGSKKNPFGAHVDHVIPISKGGTHTWANVKLAHAICNMRKGSKILEGSNLES